MQIVHLRTGIFFWGFCLGKLCRKYWEFTPPSGIRLFQYVDDLLLSGEQEKVVKEATVKMLNFVEKKTKPKTTWSVWKEGAVGREKKGSDIWEHILTGGLPCIDPERIQGILQVPLPRTRKELQRFFGAGGVLHSMDWRFFCCGQTFVWLVNQTQSWCHNMDSRKRAKFKKK